MVDEESIPWSRVLSFWALALGGCAIDLITKHWVFSSPRFFHGNEGWLIEGHIGIQKSLNEGALFGFGQGNVWLFATFAIVMVVALPLWLFYFGAARDRWLCFSLALIMGGVLGNLYDRLGLAGLEWDRFQPDRAGEKVYAVRDWILIQWNDQWVWPNFNLADALLVCGAALLLIQSFMTPVVSDSTTIEDRTNQGS